MATKRKSKSKSIAKSKKVTKSKKPLVIHHIQKHTGRLIRATPMFVHGMVIGAFFGVLLVGVLRANTIAHASPVSTPNCDNNAVIYCGASSASAVQKDYNDGDGHNKAYTIQDIYNGMGISSGDISEMSSDTQSGYVTKTGDVYVGSTLVATDAWTAGRQNISGSYAEKYGATSYYKRQPSVSFLDSELTAMVVMKNGVFQFAILVSCGNPVTATAKPAPKPPTPTPTPTPTPKPTPVPAIGCSYLHANLDSTESNGDQTYTLVAQASSVNGGKVTSFNFVLGNGATSTVTTNSLSASVSNLYTPGTWHAYVTINSSNAPSATCLATVTVNKPGTPTPPTTPPTIPTPTTLTSSTQTLPNTGPGAVILIAIASVVGGYAAHMTHRHIKRRRHAAHHHRAAHAHSSR